jgi:hypothetical protein
VPFNRKVYQSPRRGQAAVNDGFGWNAQREIDWKPIGLFNKETANQYYKDLTDISRKLINGEFITSAEHKKFENAINSKKIYLYTVGNYSAQKDKQT